MSIVFRRTTILALLAFWLSIGALPAWARQDGIVQINSRLESFLLRQQVLGRLDQFDLGRLPLSHAESSVMLDSLDNKREELSARERIELDRYLRKTKAPGAGFAQSFPGPGYRDGHDWLVFSGDGYRMQINPLLAMAAGSFRNNQLDNPNGTYWRARRGLRASGMLSDLIFFEARVEEVQERVVQPSKLNGGTIPRYRIVRSNPETKETDDGDVIYTSNSDVFDYGPAMGVLGLKTKHFEVRLGRDRYRFGYGLNSLFLSNYATEYDHLLMETALGRIRYTYLLGSMRDQFDKSKLGTSARKTGVFHRLAISVSNNVQIEFMQGMIVSKDTTSSTASVFDIAMLNPLIFLRQLEKDYNKFGNKILGAGVAWTAHPGIRFYGQVFLDELVSDQLFNGDGYWANKWGLLGGIHLVDPGQLPVEFRLEYSRIRPYTYSHSQSATNYMHFGDVLGHPAGANVRDVTSQLTLRLTPRLASYSIVSFSRRGADNGLDNFGSNPAKSYQTRTSDFDVEFLQGVRETEIAIDSYLSYELLPDLTLDGFIQINRVDNDNTGRSSVFLTGLGLRWGIPPLFQRY